MSVGLVSGFSGFVHTASNWPDTVRTPFNLRVKQLVLISKCARRKAGKKLEGHAEVTLIEESRVLGVKGQRFFRMGKFPKSKVDSQATNIFPHGAGVTMTKSRAKWVGRMPVIPASRLIQDLPDRAHIRFDTLRRVTKHY